MRIVKLLAENYKRLKAVSIESDRDTITISGANAQGKSSVLDAIWAALQNPGKDAVPKPIRDGADKARIVIELDGLTVERVITDSGTRLEVSNNSDHSTLRTPQAVLDALLGTNLDPLEFMHLSDKEQADVLLETCGLKDELEQLDAQRKTAYDERTFVNRKLKEVLAKMPAVAPKKAEKVNTMALVAELEAAERSGRANIAALLAVQTKQGLVDDFSARLQTAMEQLEDAEAALAATPAPIDAAPIRARLQNADAVNAAAAAYTQYTALSVERDDLQEKAESCTKSIADLDETKKLALANAHLAVDGLSVTDGVVELRGVPIKQASTSEQLRLCVAVAAATIPEDGIRVVRISNGSVLDSANMAVLEEMARDLNFQAWIEVVDESGKVGVVIEDGEVAVNNYEDGGQP